MARQRHPGEPIADLHRRYEAGGAGRPPRCRRPPPPRTTPTGVWGSQIRRAGDEVSGSPRLRWGHGREGGEQVRGDVRDRHHEPAGPASSLAAARAIRPRRGRRRDHRADLLRHHQLDADQRERQPPRPPRRRPASAARVRRLRAARAAHTVPAQRVGVFRGGPHLDQPGDPAGLARWARFPGGGRTRLRPVPVRGDGPLPAADRGRGGGRHRGRDRVHRPGVDSLGRLPGRGLHLARRRGPGAAQRRAPARRAGAPALRRARAARGAAAHRPGAARRGRPPHVGDRDPGRGSALQDRRSADGAGGELR